MLLVAFSLRELSFGSLMDIYREGNREHGASTWPEETEDRQLELSEQDFYNYLHDCFFVTRGARYAVWTEGGHYLSALRLEPYMDGLLLEALETVPECRGKGFGYLLMKSVQADLKGKKSVKVYSHVDKRNTASLRLHKKCGFQIVKDSACYIDGSVNTRAFTLCWET